VDKEMNPIEYLPEICEYVFNSPLECGLRSIAILLEASPNRFDIQRLVQYDYLILHSGDIEDGPESIHPTVPNRSSELMVRRSLVQHGIQFMMQKALIIQDFSTQGITYYAGEFAAPFLDALSSPYVHILKKRSAWVVSRFSSISDHNLNDFMRKNWAQWGAEFTYESFVRVGGKQQ
jgi:hypothetical protein